MIYNTSQYNVTLEQAKAYAMLHRSALVKSVLDVKSAEEAVRSAKAGYLPTVAVKAGRGYIRSRWLLWDKHKILERRC